MPEQDLIDNLVNDYMARKAGAPIDPSRFQTPPHPAPPKAPLPAMHEFHGLEDMSIPGQTGRGTTAGLSTDAKWDALKNYPGLGNYAQAAGGLGAMVGPGNSVDKRLGGASDLLRGGAAAAAPFVLPEAALAKPVKTGVQLASGLGAQQLIEKLLGGSTVGPGTQKAAADVGGLAASGLGGKLIESGPGILSALKSPRALLQHLLLGNAATALEAPGKATVAAPPAQPNLPKGYAGEAPLSSNTNSLRPAGTGTPPGPFMPNQQPPSGTVTAPMNPLAVIQRAAQSRLLQGVPTMGAPQSPAPLATTGTPPLQNAPLPQPTAAPNQAPLSSLEQVAAQLQKLKSGVKEPIVPTPGPAEATPPAMQSKGQKSSVKSTEEAQKIRAMLKKMAGTQ